jgi:hypothetical protein
MIQCCFFSCSSLVQKWSFKESFHIYRTHHTRPTSPLRVSSGQSYPETNFWTAVPRKQHGLSTLRVCSSFLRPACYHDTFLTWVSGEHAKFNEWIFSPPKFWIQFILSLSLICTLLSFGLSCGWPLGILSEGRRDRRHTVQVQNEDSFWNSCGDFWTEASREHTQAWGLHCPLVLTTLAIPFPQSAYGQRLEKVGALQGGTGPVQCGHCSSHQAHFPSRAPPGWWGRKSSVHSHFPYLGILLWELGNLLLVFCHVCA